MKWLGADPATGDNESPSSSLLGNGHAGSPQMLRHPQAGSEAPGRPQVRGSQDDSYVGYVFQRAQTDPDFPQYAASKQPARWALGDDTFIDNHHLGHDRWKVPTAKMPLQPPMMVPGQMPPPGVTPYEMHQAMLKQHELAYLSAMSAAHPQLMTPMPLRNGQITTSAKKLWGVEEHQKDDKGGGGGGGILHTLGDPHQVWRDSTWSTSDHTVSQPISMAPRRSGSFPGSDAASILSPRSSETGGLGVKMVEYVLSSSPTSKDLEPRLRMMGLNGPEGKKDSNDKAPSPFEGGSGGGQKDGDGQVVTQNGQPNSGQNGICGDEDKGFNRTPGSRQPSPAEEQLTGVGKQGGQKLDDQQSHLQQQTSNPVANHAPANVVVVPVPSNAAVVASGPVPMHHALHHPAMHPPPNMHQHAHHLQQQQLSGLDGGPGGFDPHGMLTDHNQTSASHQQQQQLFADGSSAVQGPGGYGMIAPPPQQPMDSPGVMPPFDIQALFRSQQQTAPQQLQLLQQQQFLASQQQQQQLGLAAPAAFTNGTYLINPQEPYVGTLIPGPTVLPQYYGMAPWPVYPAGLLQPGAAAAAAAAAQQQQQPQQRRPLTPSGGSDISNSSGSLTQQVPGQYQVIPAYYHENGIVMGNVRGLSNATPLRLVSPAPVLVNPGSAGNGVRLLNSQPQPIQTPPASLYSAAQPASLYSSTSGSGTPIGGLGLGSSSTGRRDSFDRNTSAFSPSLEYGRGKWPQSYGALGTVAASPSPLGLTGGSLTPPPSMSSLGGASSALGALMSSSRVLSAAPGAEAAKFRSTGALSTLHNGHVFGGSVGNGLTGSGATSPGGGLSMSAQSLFAKLGQAAAVAAGTASVTNGLDSKPPGRSRLLEDFRNNRFPNLQLRDLANHIVEFSQDQHGSRFIQQKLERASATEKQLVFTEILAHSYALMTDVFGNYVIQKFFEFGTPEQKATLAQKVRGHVLPLALQMYGCRVIQKALETISAEQQHEIVRELDGHVLKCVKDQNGNHVVQKCIECVDPHALQFIINAFQGQVFALSTHPYGCRVIQRILEHCTPEQTQPILDELHSHTEQLIQDQYGNYVIQHVLEHGKAEDKSQLINSVRGKVLVLSQHKFASNVVEKCVTHASRPERAMLIEEVCSFGDSGTGSSSSSALQTMMKDQYANYVVQKMIDVAEPGQRKVLMHKIRPHLSSLRKYTYGKHIIAKLEKYFMKNTATDLGPIGPPQVNPVVL